MASKTPPAVQPRLTQDLLRRLPERVTSEGPIRLSAPSEDYFERTAERLLEETAGGAIWVFAVGSLIWNPRMEVAERRMARVRGWRRSFCLGPMMRWRGSPEAPGRMLSLDRGGECDGVVLQMGTANPKDGLVALLKTEPPVPPEWVEAETNAGLVRAIAFVARPEMPVYLAEPKIDDLADILSSSVGTGGTMAEYVLNTVLSLAEAGIRDPHLWQLQDMIAERLEALPERPSDS